MTERAFAPSVMLSGALWDDRRREEQTMQMDQTRCHHAGCATPPISQRLLAGRWLPACPQHGGKPVPHLLSQPRQAQPGHAQPAQSQPVQTQSIPPLPPAGELSHAQAKAHLAKHMPGFGALGWDHQFEAMQILRDLCADQKAAVQLGRSQGGKPMLLLCLYPGGTRHAAAQTYLAATVDGWDKLPYDDRWTRTQELLRTHNVVEVEEAESHE